MRRVLIGLAALLATASFASAQRDCCCFLANDTDGDNHSDCTNEANAAACTAAGGIAFVAGAFCPDDKNQPAPDRCFLKQGGQKQFLACDILAGPVVVTLPYVPTMSPWAMLVTLFAVLSVGLLLLRRRVAATHAA